MRDYTHKPRLTPKEMSLIMGAVSAQIRYVARMAANNRDDEAAGRNRLNLLELRLLMEKLEAS